MPGGVRTAGWQSPDQWSDSLIVDGNIARQLLVPASVLLRVAELDRGLAVANPYGTWAASTADRPLGADRLWLRLPVGTKAGDAVSNASWSRPRELTIVDPLEVLDSYHGALRFEEGAESHPGLRPPQLGAIHAVLGYWTTRRPEPATVVMPTGTGKTETMLGLLVAARPKRLLVLVPSDALRDQVASKFDRLGVLQELGIVASSASRPVVGRVLHRFESVDNASTFAGACNVVVATVSALQATDEPVRAEFLAAFTHLFIDEAHHVEARTWSEIRDHFRERPIVQFTATPFREDGRQLQGRTIYAFPLKEAQRQGYFSAIDFKSIVDFSDPDRALAMEAVGRLRADMAAGYDHVLMARVSGVDRARVVCNLYEEIAPDLGPVAIDSRMGKKSQREALSALKDRTARIIVCINMLGEGFDLPALKVAAVHDARKSLSVTLQFIGRFARTSDGEIYGPAAVFVARKELETDRRLRDLYAEDADWNLILHDLSESAIEEQQAISDFEAGFTSKPDEVAIRSLLPKMSTVVYRAPTGSWSPSAIPEFLGRENLLTDPIGLNLEAGVAWCVVERHSPVPWGDVRSIEDVVYELFIVYFDSKRRLLYINNSANDGVFEELAGAVVGDGADRFQGAVVYRVLGAFGRFVPTNVGVLDARSQFRRFSMHVGSDVTESFTASEAGTKSQTNISGTGYRDGDRVSISASLKGRIWSPSTSPTVKHWVDWCDTVGDKLLDDTIDVSSVIGQFIIPEELTERPVGVLLAVEWPLEIRQLHTSAAFQLALGDKAYEAFNCDLVPDTSVTTGVFRFAVSNPAWSVPYEAAIESDGQVVYRCLGGEDGTVVRARSTVPLVDWLNANGLIFHLDGDRIVDGGRLYQPKGADLPFDAASLVSRDWTGADLKVESQTKDRYVDSVQYFAIEMLKQEDAAWELIVDDDGSGEIADIVALRVDGSDLVVRLLHCKYSGSPTPGARVSDLYEVCGQAQKSVQWRRGDLDPFFRRLTERAQQKESRTGVSPFEVGDGNGLMRLHSGARAYKPRFEIVIVQPGLSAGSVSRSQLELLGSTENYIRTTINARLTVWCSA